MELEPQCTRLGVTWKMATPAPSCRAGHRPPWMGPVKGLMLPFSCREATSLPSIKVSPGPAPPSLGSHSGPAFIRRLVILSFFDLTQTLACEGAQ